MDRLNCLSKESLILLQRNNLLKPLIRAELTDEILSKVEVEEKTKNNLTNDFFSRSGIQSENDFKNFLIKNNISQSDFEKKIFFETKLNSYSLKEFSHKIDSYFLERKQYLDVIIYSLIRVSDLFMAKEIYQRIVEEEDDFGNLATKYSEGIEKKTRGLVGPLPLIQGHPQLVEELPKFKPGHVQAPIFLEGSYLIIRVESFEPVKLDNFMRIKMAQELFNNFIDTQADTISKDLLKEFNSSLDISVTS